MTSKQVYLIGGVALLCIAAIAFGRVDTVTIDVLKGVFTLDKPSLVKAVDQILVSNGPEAPAAQKVLIGDIETLAYEHPISDGLRQLESEGKGPWKYLERQVTVLEATEDSHLDDRAAEVCQGGEFSSESFVIFVPDKTDFPFRQFIGVRDAPCPEGRNLIWISSAAYRSLFGDTSGATQDAKAKRFPLKPSIILPAGAQLAAINQ
jgi:hypothetical protein